MISGQVSFIIRIASAAPAVRNVTSATGNLPAHKAFAKGAASVSGLSNLITGTTLIFAICYNKVIIFSF